MSPGNSTWWKKRTNMERHLTITIVVISILLIAILATVIRKTKSAVLASHEGPKQNICLTPGCIHTASNVLENMDVSVDPCDDFYEFSCGKFQKNNYIPDGKSSVTIISKIDDEMKERLRAVIEKPILSNESRPFQLTKKLYRACMNKSLIKAKGLTYMQTLLKDLGGWPILEKENWKEGDFNWITSVYRFGRAGLTAVHFFTFWVEFDVKDSTKRIIIDPPWLGLGREVLINGLKDKFVKAYYDYMVNIAVLFGAQKDRAVEELRESLEFEMELANISFPPEEERNESVIHYPIKFFKLQQEYPSIPWLEYINTLLAPDIRVENEEEAIVKVPKYFSDFEALIAKTPKRVQANYAMWKAAAFSVYYLDEALRKREIDYLTIISGAIERETRWKECIDVVKNRMPITTGALYIRKYFSEEARQYVKDIVADIRVVFVDILKKVDWMDEQTRQKALDKAKKLTIRIAYPNELLNDTKIEEVYEALELDEENFLGSALNLSVFDTRLAYKRLRQPVNKTAWIDHCAIAYANTYYNGNENSIELPAGILQGAFFSTDRPNYMNYGAIGHSIGHEFTHGFDAEHNQELTPHELQEVFLSGNSPISRTYGAIVHAVSYGVTHIFYDKRKQLKKYDNYFDWWTPDTTKAFSTKAQCFIDQYGNYTVPEVNLNINGISSLAENIADNGGIKTAYLAYKRWLERNGEEPRLPGLKYTGRQMFWISAANVWCSLKREEELKQTMLTDVHAPDKYRNIVPLSNIQYFSDDFRCPKGSKMNPIHKCKVW